MTIAGRKINGKTTAAAFGLAGTAMLGWAGWASSEVTGNSKVNAQQDAWIAGHEQWTNTVYPATLGRIDAINHRLSEKADAIEAQIVVQTESFGEWRREKYITDREWRDEQRDRNREMLDILRDLQTRKSSDGQ